MSRAASRGRRPGDSGFVRNSNEPHVRNPIWQISVKSILKEGLKPRRGPEPAEEARSRAGLACGVLAPIAC
jgi:hypothetical protein